MDNKGVLVEVICIARRTVSRSTKHRDNKSFKFGTERDTSEKSRLRKGI